MADIPRNGPMVDVAPVRAHLATLRAEGMSVRQLSQRSGVALATVKAIIYGRSRNGSHHHPRVVHQATARALLRVRTGRGPVLVGRYARALSVLHGRAVSTERASMLLRRAPDAPTEASRAISAALAAPILRNKPNPRTPLLSHMVIELSKRAGYVLGKELPAPERAMVASLWRQAGLTTAQVAQVLGVSVRTAQRDIAA